MRRERLLFAAIAVVLVLFRSIVPTLYEGFYFDSDQAIVGLMARHLSTLHDFPLYYYGLNYLLGVQAWIIAPFFWLFRPSVAVMRIPLIGLNAVVAVCLIAGLSARERLAPAVAFAAALPFVMPTPAVSSQLLETAGASIEPFVYVLLLWQLARRPFAFGLLLAFGFMHREFTIFAVPALAIARALATGGWRLSAGWADLRWIAHALAGFALMWLVVDDLKLHLLGSGAALQMASLRGQMCFDVAHLRQSVQALVTEAVPALVGGRAMPVSVFRMNTPLVAGSSLAGWAIAATAVLIAARLLFLAVAKRGTGLGDDADDGFGVYLACIGLFTLCAYPLSCNITPGAPPLLRYLLFGVLLPVGCAATYLRRESSPVLRGIVVGVLVGWSALNLIDNARLVRVSVADPPSNEHRALTDYLLTHQVRYARAIYWDAYVVDFLSRERVITASVDLVRIPEYQRIVNEHGESAVNLARLPCTGGQQIASWCVQKE